MGRVGRTRLIRPLQGLTLQAQESSFSIKRSAIVGE